MFPVGGLEVILGGVAASGVLCCLLGLLLRRRLPFVTAWSIAGLVWSLAVVALVTLIPTSDPGIVPQVGRPEVCSWEIGGPAPKGFWIFSGTQRTLNSLVFVPSGALLVLAASRWRAAWVLVPVGLGLLAAYSVGIELTQFVLARLDRRCDVTDVIDNVTGAAVGVGIGLVLATILRPWRSRP